MATISHTSDQNRKAREAFRLANDLHLELIAGTKVFDYFQKQFSLKRPPEVVETGTRRMCFWYLINTLSKWMEYYELYKSVIPDDVKMDAKILHMKTRVK